MPRKLILSAFTMLSVLLNFCVLAQAEKTPLQAKWKFTKVVMPDHTTFDLDNLKTSYKQFFNNLKQETYHGTITPNDSLYINYLFEKTVNDISRMFIEFKQGNKYVSNSFNRQGDISENTESGTYVFNPLKKEVITRLASKKTTTRFKVISIDKNKLVLKYNSFDGPVITCKKVDS